MNQRLKKLMRVDGVDLVALPGPDGLTKEERASEYKTAIQQAALLIGAHNAQALAIVAHQRCAGHPVDDHQHEHDVAATAKALANELKFSGPVWPIVATYGSDTKWGLKVIR
jgi:hypothetical protein